MGHYFFGSILLIKLNHQSRIYSSNIRNTSARSIANKNDDGLVISTYSIICKVERQENESSKLREQIGLINSDLRCCKFAQYGTYSACPSHQKIVLYSKLTMMDVQIYFFLNCTGHWDKNKIKGIKILKGNGKWRKLHKNGLKGLKNASSWGINTNVFRPPQLYLLGKN